MLIHIYIDVNLLVQQWVSKRKISIQYIYKIKSNINVSTDQISHIHNNPVDYQADVMQVKIDLVMPLLSLQTILK